MNFLLSLLPILLILYVMVARRWSAARAGSLGYLSALAISIFFFGASPVILAYAHLKALILALDVLLIIWAAFLFYRVAEEAGAISRIGQALPFLTPDRGMQALVIGWVFASFLQGVGGFGVPVAVVAPILVGLGFAPLASVLIPSIGHGWAVTFGSLGSSFQALIASTGLTAEILTGPTAIFLGIACLATGPMVAHAANGWQAVRRLLIFSLVVGSVMGLVQYIVAVSGAWNIAAFSAAIAGLLLSIPIIYLSNHQRHNQEKLNQRLLLIAVSGYAILITIILGAQLIPSIKSSLGSVFFQVQFPETVTSKGFLFPAHASRKISLFGHNGSLLLYATMLSFIIYKLAGMYKTGAEFRILNGTINRVLSSSVSIVSMVSMAIIMENTGMTDTLARTLAVNLGGIYPLIAPWIGAIGAFMTGSNTNSNVVFGALQLQTAALLGYSIPVILAAQTAGAALGSVAAPTKIVVGASTAGMAGKEGEIMRHLLVYVLMLLLLMSIVSAIGIWLF